MLFYGNIMAVVFKIIFSGFEVLALKFMELSTHSTPAICANDRDVYVKTDIARMYVYRVIHIRLCVTYIIL